MVRKISDVMTSFRLPDVFNFKSMNERYVEVLIERTTDVKSTDREECHHAPYSQLPFCLKKRYLKMTVKQLLYLIECKIEGKKPSFPPTAVSRNESGTL